MAFKITDFDFKPRPTKTTGPVKITDFNFTERGAQAPAAAEPLDERAQFAANAPRTKLEPEEELDYRDWMNDIGHTKAKGFGVDDDFNGTDYDYRGFFRKNGYTKLGEGAHLTDEFKLPNHPTFSRESRFAQGGAEKYAGTWGGDDGETFIPPQNEADDPVASVLEKRKMRTGFDGAVDRITRFARAFGAGIPHAMAGVAGAAEGPLSVLSENVTGPLLVGSGLLPEDPVGMLAAEFQKSRLAYDELASETAGQLPDDIGKTEKAALSGMQSASGSLLALGLAALTGNPNIALTAMAGSAGGNKYGEAINNGASPARALTAAIGEGTFEYLGEKIPVDALFEGLKLGKGFVSLLATQMATEIPAEQATTVAQDFVDWAVLNPDKSVKQFMAERPGAAYDTLIATVVGTALQTSIAKGTDSLLRQAQPKEGGDPDLERAKELDALARGDKKGAEAVIKRVAAGVRKREVPPSQSDLVELEDDEDVPVVTDKYDQTDKDGMRHRSIEGGEASEDEFVDPTYPDRVYPKDHATASTNVPPKVKPIEPPAAKLDEEDPQMPLLHRAYHGSGVKFDKFDLGKINTGEGNQSFGWGLYFAESKDVADIYTRSVHTGKMDEANKRMSELAKIMEAEALPGQWRKYKSAKGEEAAAEYDRVMASKNEPGKMYEVEIDDNAAASMLDWDERLDPKVYGTVLKKFADRTGRPPFKVGAVLEELELMMDNDQRLDANRDHITQLFESYQKNPNDPRTRRQLNAYFREYKDEGPDALAYMERKRGDPANAEIGWIANHPDHYTGEFLYRALSRELGGDRQASEALRAAGIHGIKYLDANSRNAAPDQPRTRNLVLFDDSLVKVLTIDGEQMQAKDADEDESEASQTNSRAFKRWFGESKVRNEDGTPLRVYHGTHGDFDVFDFSPRRAGLKTGNNNARLGAFFSDDPGEASRYAGLFRGDKDFGGKVLPVYLNISNPYEMSYAELDGYAMAVFEKMKERMNAGKSFTDAEVAKWKKQARTAAFKRREELIAQGYDGIVAKVGGRREFVAFQPTQIKSAIGNRGTFDPNEPSILAHRKESEKQTDTAAFKKWFGKSKVTKNGKPLTVYHGTGETTYTPATKEAGSKSARAELEKLAKKHGIRDWMDVPAVMERVVRDGGYGDLGITEKDAKRARELLTKAKSKETAPSSVDMAFSVFNMPSGSKELGAHFGTKEQASQRGYEFPFYLRIENPLRLADLGTWDYQSVIREARKAGVKISETEYDSVFNANDNNDALRKLLESKGIDGIVYKNEAEGVGDSWIVFSPEQIKSADKNSGAFDPADPDITKQLSDAQREAGNYKKERERIQGLAIAIENPAGSTRSGTAESGEQWSVKMRDNYGYINGTIGADGEQVDVFTDTKLKGYVKPGSEKAQTVYVMNQLTRDGKRFDEHKVMLGPTNMTEARQMYLRNFDKGWNGVGEMFAMPIDVFKAWVMSPAAKRQITQADVDRAYKKAGVPTKVEKKKAVALDRAQKQRLALSKKATEIRKELARRMPMHAHLPPVYVHETWDQLPIEIRNKIKDDPGGVTGMFDPTHGRAAVHLIVGNGIESVDEALETWAHETVGHFGLRSILGGQYGAVMDRIYEAFPAHVQRIADRYNLDTTKQAKRRLAAEEFMAFTAQKIIMGKTVTTYERTWIDKIMDLLRAGLQRLGFRTKLTEKQMLGYIQDAANYVWSPAGVRSEIEASYAGILRQQRAPTYYSQLYRAMTDPKKVPESSTVGEYRRLIEGAVKRGEIKESEVKWTGILDALDLASNSSTGHPPLKTLLDNRAILPARLQEAIAEAEKIDGSLEQVPFDTSLPNNGMASFGPYLAGVRGGLLPEFGSNPFKQAWFKVGELARDVDYSKLRVNREWLLQQIKANEVAIEVVPPLGSDEDQQLPFYETREGDGNQVEPEWSYIQESADQLFEQGELESRQDAAVEDELGARVDDEDHDEDAVTEIHARVEREYREELLRVAEHGANDSASIKWEETLGGFDYEIWLDDPSAPKQYKNFSVVVDGNHIGDAKTFIDAKDIASKHYLKNVRPAERPENALWGEYTIPGGKNYRERLFIWKGGEKQIRVGAMSTHFGEDSDFIVHARFDERTDAITGKKALFVDELQSDWHQFNRDQMKGAEEQKRKADSARERLPGLRARLAESSTRAMDRAIATMEMIGEQTFREQLFRAVPTARAEDANASVKFIVEKYAMSPEPMKSVIDDLLGVGDSARGYSRRMAWLTSPTFRNLYKAERDRLLEIHKQTAATGGSSYFVDGFGPSWQEWVTKNAHASDKVDAIHHEINESDLHKQRILFLNGLTMMRDDQLHTREAEQEIAAYDEPKTVPAPFEDTYMVLGAKWFIQEAVRNGFETVMFAPGSVHGVRWLATKYLPELSFRNAAARFKGNEDLFGKADIFGEEGGSITAENVSEYIQIGSAYVRSSKLKHLVGQKAAKWMLDHLTDNFEEVTPEKAGGPVLMATGGPGSRQAQIHMGSLAIYDEIYVNQINKFVKKYGAKIVPGRMSFGSGELARGLAEDEGLEWVEHQGMRSGVKVWQLAITPELKKAAEEDGFPLFHRKDVEAKAQQRDAITNGDTWHLEEGDEKSSIWNYLVFQMQDRFEGLLRVQKSIEKFVGEKLPDALNVYRREEMYHGRIKDRIDDYDEQWIQPLVKMIRSSWLSGLPNSDLPNARS